MGNFISWTSEDGLNHRDNTFMPEFGKDVSYSDPGGTSFGRNTEAFSNSVMSQVLNKAQKDEAARQATTEFERISNPETYDSTEAPESFHLGEIVGADTIDEKWDPEKWKGAGKWNQLKEDLDTFYKEHDVDNLSKEETYELGKMYEAAAAYAADKYSTTKKDVANKPSEGINSLIGNTLETGWHQTADKYSKLSKNLLDQAHSMDKADEEAAKEKAKDTVGSSTPTSSGFTADTKGESKVDTTPSETFEDTTPSKTFEDVKATIDEKWAPEKWKGPGKWNQLKTEIDTFMKEHGDINTLSKEEAYELGKMYEATAALSADRYSTEEDDGVAGKLSKGFSRLIGKARGIDTSQFADRSSAISKELLDRADAMDKLDKEKHAKLKEEEKAKEKVGSSAPASSRFTADMKGEAKVDTTPSKTFEDVKNEFKDEFKDESNKELNRDPLPNVEPKDYTDNAYKPEFKNDSTNIADIKKAAEQTGADTETVKAIAGAPKFIQTIESKLGDLLLKMGRRAARYNPLTLAVALYESVKNGEGMEKSIDKAIDALGLERDSMSQDEYDALYKEIEGIRSSIDRGDFKISLAGRGTAAATSDATPTDFFDGLLNTDKTDYSGYNAGLKASDTASDKNTKEIIVRVYKKDPVLRLLKC